ncbi:MAG: hypothetical protein F7B17_03985 [Desulfurococcales archaeon]|nr:hypothetical protein [Desulfurococcales archaeon]
MLRLRVLYCDEYYGLTIKWWIEEYRWLIEKEVCGPVKLNVEKLPEDACRSSPYPVYLEVDGEIVIEGLPGEEGYLVETLKSLATCREG